MPAHRTCTQKTRPAHRLNESSASVLETLVAIAAVAALITAVLASGFPRTHAVDSHVVVVSEGDSLWTLARENPVDGYATAQTVDLIVALNRLDTVLLQPGMRLIVPAAGSVNDRVASR